MMLIVLLINAAALYIVCQNGLPVEPPLPRPFPWKPAMALCLVLLIGGVSTGHIERGVAFVTLLSSVIIADLFVRTWRHSHKWLSLISVVLTAFIIADAFNAFNTPNMSGTGEDFGFIRRPYLLENPNVKADWLLLLWLSPVTFIGIIFAQSRGALLGYMAGAIGFVPKRYRIYTLAIGTIALAAAALIRPVTFFGRVDIWSDGLRIFMEHPLAGSGTGSYLALTTTGMATAHNAALTIAAENGLIGLAAFIAWIAALVPMVARSGSLMKFNLLAFSVQQLVDDQWLHPVTAILLGMILAVCLFQEDK